jgi:hypothetical protein
MFHGANRSDSCDSRHSLNYSLPVISQEYGTASPDKREHNRSMTIQKDPKKSVGRKPFNPYLSLLAMKFKISVADMVQASRNQVENGIDGYYVPKSKTFEHQYKPFISNSKQQLDFVSYVMKKKKDLPSPDKYETGLNLLDKVKKFPLYRTDRKTYCDDIKKETKKSPGVGTYNTKGLPDKIKGNFKVTLDRCSVVDEAKAMSLLVPSHYPSVKMELTKDRASSWKIRAPTDKENEMEKEQVRRKDVPSPFSYKTEEAFKNVRHRNQSWQISKTQTKKFTEYIASKKKFVPGVGHYEIAKPLDFVSKPMRKY